MIYRVSENFMHLHCSLYQLFGVNRIRNGTFWRLTTIHKLFDTIWEYHYGKGLISVFQGFFASIDKIFILAGRLVTGLSFYGISALIWYFLIS